MEPRYYSQVPFRGCSLMVKPQSSKLITRVRFPSSPRANPSDVVGGIFCARGCRESLTGENTFPRALGIFALQPVIPSRFRVSTLSRRGPFFFPRGDDGNPFRMRICFLARSESARSSSSSPHRASTQNTLQNQRRQGNTRSVEINRARAAVLGI